MTAVTSTTNFDYEFDAAKGIQRNNLPPFAQRMRKAADLVWEEGYQQPFIRELGEGTLQRERFAFYLLQDFRYVNDYARVHALGLAKATDPEIMAFMLKVQNGALQVETEVHRSYLASYGITEEQMNNVRQSAFARAYTSNYPFHRLWQGYSRHSCGRAAVRLCMRIMVTVLPPSLPTRLTTIRTKVGSTCIRPTSSGRIPCGCSNISRNW